MKCSGLKKFTAKTLRWLPVQSKTWGSPRYFIPEAKEWVRQEKEKGSKGVDYISVVPSFRRVLDPARSFEMEPDERFNLWYDVQIPEVCTVVLKEGRYYQFSSITSDGGLLGDISRLPDHDRIRGKFMFPILESVGLPKIQAIRGTVGIIAMMGACANYCHWMLEELPRIEVLRRSGFSLDSLDHLMISGNRSLPEEESLDALGVPKNKIIKAGLNDHFECETMVRPYIGCQYMMQTWIIEFLQKTFLKGTNETGWTGKRIYLSRDKSKIRRVVNEEEVTDYLRKKGFLIVHCDQYSIREQAAICHGASAIVAPHGSALTNIVFCRPGIPILEIFSPSYIEWSYWTISQLLKMDYSYFFGEGERPETKDYWPRLCTQEEVEAPIVVPMDRLKRFIERLP